MPRNTPLRASATEGVYDYENSVRAQGYNLICGVDEAGRGPLAGPVVAAACILPPGCAIEGLTDSKALSERARERLFKCIEESAICFAVGISEVEVIDSINILQATYTAMRQALSLLNPAPDYVLVDGWAIPNLHLPQQGIIGGDRLSSSISAASILAKVTRDRMMFDLDSVYPEYGFAKHKGYCTKEHLRAIHEYGRTPCHRQSFKIPDVV